MNRREFTGLLAAGVVFPVDYVKGLAARGDVPRSKSGPRIYCCGSDDYPVTDKQISQITAFLEKKRLGTLRSDISLSWYDKHCSVIQYGRGIGAPISAIYQIDFPLDRLVVGIRSNKRPYMGPAHLEDLFAEKDELLKLADTTVSPVYVTHHNFYPYEYRSGPLYSAPMVMTYLWTQEAERSGIIRRVPALWHHAFVTASEWKRHDHPW